MGEATERERRRAQEPAEAAAAALLPAYGFVSAFGQGAEEEPGSSVRRRMGGARGAGATDRDAGGA